MNRHREIEIWATRREATIIIVVARAAHYFHRMFDFLPDTGRIGAQQSKKLTKPWRADSMPMQPNCMLPVCVAVLLRILQCIESSCKRESVRRMHLYINVCTNARAQATHTHTDLQHYYLLVKSHARAFTLCLLCCVLESMARSRAGLVAPPAQRKMHTQPPDYVTQSCHYLPCGALLLLLLPPSVDGTRAHAFKRL